MIKLTKRQYAGTSKPARKCN